MSNTLDITMDQGSTLDYTFKLTDTSKAPLDLTDYDAQMMVRSSFGSKTILVDCSLINGKLLIPSPPSGELKLKLDPADTSSIKFPEPDDSSFTCVYDIELTDALGNVFKPARGSFTLEREVTHN